MSRSNGRPIFGSQENSRALGAPLMHIFAHGYAIAEADDRFNHRRLSGFLREQTYFPNGSLIQIPLLGRWLARVRSIAALADAASLNASKQQELCQRQVWPVPWVSCRGQAPKWIARTVFPEGVARAEGVDAALILGKINGKSYVHRALPILRSRL